MKHLLLAPALCLAFLIGCSDPTAPSAEIPAAHLDSVAREFNRGIGLMERFQPEQAIIAFEEVVRLAPGWASGRLNLGIALLNVNDEASSARAEQELAWVVEQQPRNPFALYSLGMLLRHAERADEAQQLFERVVAIDPNDADAHYQLGILALDHNPAAARSYFEQTLVLMPHHESACYRLAALLRKAGEPDGARLLLDRFRALQEVEAGEVSGMKYGEMGRYANVLRALGEPVLAPELLDLPEFREVAADFGIALATAGSPGWAGGVSSSAEPSNADALLNAGSFGPGVAVADLDGDGDLDLYLPGTGTDANGTLLTNADGQFSVITGSGIDGRNVIGAFFGDYDQDGDPDLFLSCFGPDRLYRNEGNGSFRDVTITSGIAGENWISVGAAWADIDHDGDLDLLVARYGLASGDSSSPTLGAPNAVWRNNGDGSFQDVAVTEGLDGGSRATFGVALVDLDDDRDLDLIFLHASGGNQIFHNDRAGQYQAAHGQYPELAGTNGTLGLLSGDIDQDGREDLLLLRSAQPPRLLLQQQRGVFQEDSRYSAALNQFESVAGVLLGDYDLDGDLDLALLDAEQGGSFGHWVLAKDRGGIFHTPVPLGNSAAQPQPRTRGAVAADLNGDGSLDLLLARAGAATQLWSASPSSERRWLQVLPVLKDADQGIRAEPDAEGLLVEVKTGLHTQIRRLTSAAGYLGSAPQRLHFGLGSAEAADYVRLSWPDAVLQSELEVPADQEWQIVKIKRKPSSCPILFSWDGERFAYVTDFLGVGGMGFFVEPGVYAPPDPTEDVRIPPEMVAVRDGKYLLRVTEPLEEVTYLDQLHLQVYDHPEEWQVFPDERFTGTAPFPTGNPIATATAARIFPVAAQTDQGEDLLASLRHVDRRYAEPPVDSRFIGYARDHWIELDFGNRLRDHDPANPLVLFLHGWVEYTYSHVNYAAWQAGIIMRSPWIELPDGNGGWQPAVTEMGFPAGLPRMMTFDISALPLQEDGRLRIRTNMEIFWDQIYVGENLSSVNTNSPGFGSDNLSDQKILQHTLLPTSAELRSLGYPREYSPDGANPTVYDYHRLDLGVPFKNMRGTFTEHGDVRELLSKVDDRFVILARGEEVRLEFDATQLPPLLEGWSRTLVLHSDGYCKDMDLYTAFPDTVGPLPFHAMSNYPPSAEDREKRKNGK